MDTRPVRGALSMVQRNTSMATSPMISVSTGVTAKRDSAAAKPSRHKLLLSSLPRSNGRFGGMAMLSWVIRSDSAEMSPRVNEATNSARRRAIASWSFMVPYSFEMQRFRSLTRRPSPERVSAADLSRERAGR